MLYQAIIIKYLPATDRRPSRWKATAEAGSVTLSYDHAKNATDNAMAAAMALVAKNSWTMPGRWVIGGLPKGDYVCVFAEENDNTCGMAEVSE